MGLLMKRTALKPGKPLKRKASMPSPRASMRARRPGKAKPKTVYRNRALLALAKGQPCLLRVPGFCVGGTKSTVSCHANFAKYGKGAGIKAHDWAIAFGCYGCHQYIDQSGAPYDQKLGYFEAGLVRTRQAIIELGKWPAEAERGFLLVFGEAV